MALNQIRIIVVNGGGSGGDSSGNSNKKTTANNLQEKQNQKLSKAIKTFHHPVDAGVEKVAGVMSPASALATTMAVDLGVAFAKQAFNYHISNVGRSNGDSNYQAQIGRQLEIVGDVTNVVGSMLSGAATGAAIGGVPGMVVGAVVSTASSLMSIGFRQAERERTYQYQLFRDRNSQAVSLSRANYSVWTGRAR